VAAEALTAGVNEDDGAKASDAAASASGAKICSRPAIMCAQRRRFAQNFLYVCYCSIVPRVADMQSPPWGILS
jgi:hypothetical protein